MNTQRFIQVLQELINNQNTLISSANSYLYETQMNSYNSYDQQAYQNLQNENYYLNNRIQDMTNTINQLQNDNFNLNNLASSNNTSGEVDSLRNLVSALTNDKDYLQSQIASKEQQLVDANNALSNKDLQMGSSLATISSLQEQVTDLNNKLSEALATLDQKQAEVVTVSDRAASLQAAVNVVKSKVAAELQEALQDIDEALDENIK